MKEKWKPIPGYKRFYSISSFGRIRKDKKYNNRPKNGIVQSRIKKDGYRQISLYKNFTPKTFKLSRLMALTFIGKPKKGEQVNHKDGNKSNDKLDNLEYTTARGNMLHAIKLGLKKIRYGSDVSKKLNERDVKKIRHLYFINKKSQTEISKIFNIAQTTVHHIVKRKTWKHI